MPPAAHPFRQGPGLAKTPARKQQPDLPVSWGRQLVGWRDRRPGSLQRIGELRGKGISILGSLIATIGKHGPRSALGIEIAQRRDHGFSRFRKRRHRTDDPGDRSRVIGIDQDVVLDIQQRAALQLAGQSAAIPEILVQPPR
jgi:hypothetical protein